MAARALALRFLLHRDCATRNQAFAAVPSSVTSLCARSHGRGPSPCSARASGVTAFAGPIQHEPRTPALVHTLVNSAPKNRICDE